MTRWQAFALIRSLRMLPERVRVSAYYRLRPVVPEAEFQDAALTYAPGIRMRLQPGDDSHSAMAATGIYERPSTRIVATLAREGGLLVDVGANFGYYTLLWLGTSPANDAVAFEPVPSIAASLRDNLARNGLAAKARVLQAAADTTTSKREFQSGTGQQTSWGRLAPSGGNLTVDAVRLDEILPQRQVALLKLDCEGADAWVLEGATALFESRSIGTVMFENHHGGCEKLGIDPQAAPRLLARFGFSVRALGDGNWLATKPTLVRG
jgi:FkbM family methyltransferase